MPKLVNLLFLCLLAGCAGGESLGYSSSACSQPGTYACQIEQYQRVGF